MLSERTGTENAAKFIQNTPSQTFQVPSITIFSVLETQTTEGTASYAQEALLKAGSKPEPPSLFPVQSTIRPSPSIIKRSTMTILNENDLENYVCPKECDCDLLENPSRQVYIRCNVQYINDVTYFDVFNSTTLPSILTLYCDPLTSMNSKLYPFMFRGLQSCISLTFSNCQFDYVPEKTFYGMMALKELIIYNAKHITFHTAVFEKLSSLEELSIIQSGMSSAPSLCHLHHLRLVNFTDNNIGTLDESGLLCNDSFRNLHVIELCKNSLRKIIINISEISDNLLRFSVSDNKIEQIADYSLRGLYLLISLDIENNLITSLSRYVFQDLNGLEKLSLADNRLSNFYSGTLSHLRNLTYLQLSNLSLNISIFNEIRNHQNLKELVLKNNFIENIQMSSLSLFSQLKYFDISHNYIRNLTDSVFTYQENLEELNISGNFIERLGKKAFTGLSKLYILALHHNKIHIVERECLQPLLALRVLYISYNAIEYLPSFQGLINLQVLDLSHNNIKYLDNSTFLGASEIAVIFLNNNRIRTIRARAFRNLQRLRKLLIENNEIYLVEYDAFGDTRIIEMSLRNNNISDINVFRYNNFARLSKLDLSYNNIRLSISYDLFSTFEDIETLMISNNKIEGVSSRAFESLHNLQFLDLSYNEIRYLNENALKTSSRFTLLKLGGNPFTCDCNMQWIKKWFLGPNKYCVRISDLYDIRCTLFDGKAILYRLAIDDFVCQYKRDCSILNCSCCNVDACACLHICPDICTCFHNSDRSVNSVRCEGRGIDKVPKEMPLAATHVYLDGNNITLLSIHSFPEMIHLEYLSMNDSNIHTIQDYTFSTLSSLKTLHLNENSISTISSKTFFGLNKLQYLSLSKNRITFIEVGSFSHLPITYKLDLCKNYLRKVDEYVFYELSFASSLSLSGNPWTCDCEFLVHFGNFLYSNVKTVKDFSALTCTANTTSLQNTTIVLAITSLSGLCPVITVSQSKELAHNVVSALATLLGAFVIIAIIASVIFLNRDFLKVWIYIKCGWRICNQEKEQDVCKPYDAFVSYSSKDNDYVVHELIPVLEKYFNYRICVHYRNFSVGAAIAENIVSSVESSKRVIVVLSKNFIESDWCHYEFQIAYQRLLSEKKNRIIMILLGDIDKSKLVPELKHYIQANTDISHHLVG
ncbi:hypothetical protein CHS0354_018245 [Potamilus streckersoni]|uniref:TIR domain-containing protein n=1 Tax=Potamilus streckersoni TaxID=2493646 RepID=A0AAE0VXR6_9BIVA|nr:hypothetical protein CHS0354_018245 [Potamilus streckersoni]